MTGSSKETPKLRVLILSVGSLCAHNVLCLLQPRRADWVVIGTNSVAEAAGAFLCDAAYLAPPAREQDAYAAALIDIIAAERPDIVVPTREDDVLALARLKRSYAGPAVLLAGSLAAAEILDDKRLSAAFAQRHGLPFAPTADNLADARTMARTWGYPLIAKPARGNGSRGVGLVLETSHLEAVFEDDGMLVQPFLDGPVETEPYQELLRRGLPFWFSLPEPNQHSFQIVIGADGELSQPYAAATTW